jgi:hypothetical protein
MEDDWETSVSRLTEFFEDVTQQKDRSRGSDA